MRWCGRLTTVVSAVAVMVVMVAEVKHTQAARILMAVPLGTKSHNNFFVPIAEHLARRNHTVTYVAGYTVSSKSPNIRVVKVPDEVQILNKVPNLFTNNQHLAMASIMKEMEVACVNALAYEGVQKLRDEKFDLVIVHAAVSECFLSFVHQLQVPFIYGNPNKPVGVFAKVAGCPAFPSLSASFMLDPEYPLTFMGRTISTLYDLMGIMSYEWSTLPNMEAECRARKLCPEDMPSLLELRLKSSLFIANSVRTMENPTLPYTPTVVHAGGIHCRPAEPLPEDLQQWVAGAGKPGVILFSLGSLVKPSSMPEEYRKVLLEVFGSLQQRVLWKWDEDAMEGLPPNVRLSKWLPQQDILGHPQLRLFITHGGLFSSQEATYHGVPVIGLPVTLDQHHNMRTVQREGWGRVLQWEDLTNESLRVLILQTLDDSRLLEEVRRRWRVMRDQPMLPGDWATYWVEYVLRHQGARHLRSPALDIPWLEADCRARKLCPEDMPSLSELRLKGSLFISNSVRTMENPTLPYTPTVVHAGGIHCRPAEPLPEDLQQWVAGAGKPGVILFSLGTLVKSSTLPEEYRKVLLEVFGSLQQRVLWKWDEDAMEGLPPNVRLSKWLPQQDILGHPQLRLFITHGGLFSTQEASYHGVPVLGLPVAVDQKFNMMVVQREGWGRFLRWEDLTYDSLRGNIFQIIVDSRFQEEAQRRARVMRDQPMSPGDWATYWVEYVLRHQGARHLRSPALDIPWYQLYNSDVWAVVVVVTLVAAGLAIWIPYRILRALVGCCCRSRKTKKD
ncbi:UDP-glycosyltransferase UGT5-like isoform X1 [Eriocheir sinensis]|uniref:UDP-glycosyltransferase UGT5-like isoform X1 n=1 Tax=Eriocheir sinensis TaxID=95602 RepID=UPI0021C9B3EA|nr:UDP-glycosyltransferase UGT5-like isoform X1 [Eriocheir sinensis]